MKEFNPSSQEETFQTGKTRPPKNRQGLIAVLLVAVILLGGIASVLGIVNIRLLDKLDRQSRSQDPSLSFFYSEQTIATERAQDHVPGNPWLGISGQEVSCFYQLYFQLPQGLYITQVDSRSDAAAKGLTPGDILLSLDGQQITDESSLTSLLHRYDAGDQVTAVVYRKGQQYEFSLTVGQAN